MIASRLAPERGPAIGATGPTVLVVDDNEAFRARARELLIAGGYRVVGEAGTAAEAVAAARRFDPDVLLLDVQLPDADGFAVAEQLEAGQRGPRIVLISSREAADYGSRLKRAPTVGFIHKPELSRRRLEQVLASAS